MGLAFKRRQYAQLPGLALQGEGDAVTHPNQWIDADCKNPSAYNEAASALPSLMGSPPQIIAPWFPSPNQATPVCSTNGLLQLLMLKHKKVIRWRGGGLPILSSIK